MMSWVDGNVVAAGGAARARRSRRRRGVTASVGNDADER